MSEVDNKATIEYTEKSEKIVKKSNTVITELVGENLKITKAVDKIIAQVGDILTYTIVITNLGITEQSNVKLIDALTENGLEYVVGSLKIGGVATSGDLNVGIIIPSVPVGTTTVEFKATILPKS